MRSHNVYMCSRGEINTSVKTYTHEDKNRLCNKAESNHA